jgi:hypothetical protein
LANFALTLAFPKRVHSLRRVFRPQDIPTFFKGLAGEVGTVAHNDCQRFVFQIQRNMLGHRGAYWWLSLLTSLGASGTDMPSSGWLAAIIHNLASSRNRLRAMSSVALSRTPNIRQHSDENRLVRTWRTPPALQAGALGLSDTSACGNAVQLMLTLFYAPCWALQLAEAVKVRTYSIGAVAQLLSANSHAPDFEAAAVVTPECVKLAYGRQRLDPEQPHSHPGSA